MKSDKAITVYRELCIGSRLNVKLSYWGEADAEVRNDSYQIEIETPLPAHHKVLVETIKNRYGLSEIRIPVRYQHSGNYRGKLVLS